MTMGKYGGDRICLVSLEVPPRYCSIAKQMKRDMETIVAKNAVYGDSWKKRGGAGAFLTAVRPWDRLEEMAKRHDWDVFKAGALAHGDADSDILDSIRDVRNYLFLIEQEIVESRAGAAAEKRSTAAKAPLASGVSEHQPPLFDAPEEPPVYDFERGHPADRQTAR